MTAALSPTFMTIMLAVLSLAVLIPNVSAFTIMSTSRTYRATALFRQPLNEIDEMCIENVAELCLKADAALLSNDCDLEEYQALINQLQDQKDWLEQHVAHVDNLLHRLKADGLAMPEPEETYFAG